MDWQRIGTAPEDGTYVLMSDGYVVQEGFYIDGAWQSCHPQCQLWSQPTHWMPLPPPPKVGE